ncbi:neurogenic locus notch homolog protein 1-like [Anneissia japonica]|uniref:neurogenic locus notch homolog protein 1-like n=1 Tax=Anneissia japonica TaxID=1529436 RepID=UPI0014257916|nr:neurogenic locus notch homolog protein 1-like [Anneissia japonica]
MITIIEVKNILKMQSDLPFEFQLSGRFIHGQYIYASAVVEGTDVSRSKGEKARIVSPNITTSDKGKLLRFYRHMYGNGLGALNVYILFDGVVKLPRSTWRRTASKGRGWKLGEVLLPTNAVFQIVFESVIGKNKFGDIAIDDITIEDISWDCNFERDMCEFQQYDQDEFDWWSNSGKTSTKGTGPPIDHTRETSKGTYMYIEATYQIGHDSAILISRPFVKDPDRYCGLSFFYHMNGDHIGALKLHLLYGNKTGFDQAIWSDSTNHDNNWIEKVAYLNKVTGLFQFAFEGVRSVDGHKGDIAIDDVKLLGSGCSVFPGDFVPGNCSASPCKNSASCIEMVGGVVCNCTIGHSGKLCETVNLCAFKPCHNGGTCMTVGEGFACRCSSEWSGTTCKESTIVSTVSWQKATKELAPTTPPNLPSARIINKPTRAYSTPPEETTKLTSSSARHSKPEGTTPLTLSPRVPSIPPLPVVITHQPVSAYPFRLLTTSTDAGGRDGDITDAAGKGVDIVVTDATSTYIDVTDSADLVTTKPITHIDYCNVHRCIHGDCFNENNGYRCQCLPGWKGNNCDEDLDECTEVLDTCANNGTCVNTEGSYTCTCADGWMGKDCQLECEDNNYNCDYWAGTKECTINPNYMLKYCQFSCGVCQPYECVDRHENCALWASIGECNNNPFYMLGMCHRSCGVCIDDECSVHPCQNGATCTDLENSYSCACSPGWGGVNCHVPLNECNSDPCQNNGTCIDSIAYYECVCTDGYEGVHCENETDHCSSEPCLNGGVCDDTGLAYLCTCADGFSGVSCENDTNECLSNPCLHGGTCLDQASSYLCECPEEWTGEYCQHDFDECQSNPCRNGGSCYHGIGHRFYLCRCPDGYEGINCDYEIDECQSSPCKRGATCLDLMNRYECVCEPGWTGSQCQLDINECASKPCLNEAKCLDLVNHYTCLCPPLYSGTNCEIRVSRCAKSPCLNGGTCNELSNNIKNLCHCTSQWEGIYCEISKIVPTTPAPTTTSITTTVTKLTTTKVSLTTEEPEISGGGSSAVVSTPRFKPTKSKFEASTNKLSTQVPSTENPSTPKLSTRKSLTSKPTTRPATPKKSTPIPLTTLLTKSTVKQRIVTSPTQRTLTTADGSVAETNKAPKKHETSLFLIIAIAAGTFTVVIIILILIGVRICRRNNGGRYEQFPLDSTAGGMTWASESSGGSLSYQKFMDCEPTLDDASSFRENSSL